MQKTKLPRVSGTGAWKRRLTLVLFGALCAQGASAQQGNGLKFLNPPGGGAVVYGSLENQKSQPDGMVFMLKQVHGHFGDKPKVGKLVAAKDGSSLAAFFTLTDNVQTHQPVSGLVLIQSHGKQMDAAIAYDFSRRFATTEPGILRALAAAWQPAGAAATRPGAPNGPATSARPSAGSSRYATQQLYRSTGGDRSIAIDLPPDWEIKGIGGGSIVAEGPHQEQVAVGLMWQGMANLIGGDQFSSYTRIATAVRRRNGRSAGTYQLIQLQHLPPDQASAAPVMAQFTVDFHDGHGPMKGNARIAVDRRGTMMMVSQSYMPAGDYDSENPMVNKIMASARQNVSVISAEGAADLARIRSQARANDIATQAQNQRREDQAGAYEAHRQQLNAQDGQAQQHMNDINAGGADFQNYILDRSVVQNTETGNAATASNNWADALVKAAPDKFVITTNRQLQSGDGY